MQDETDAQGTLFALQNGVNSSGFQLTPLEKRVAAVVSRVLELRPDDFMIPAYGELAMDVAANIAKGNIKGRSIGNEVQQLDALLDKLRGEDADADATQLPPGVLNFVQAMQSRPSQPTPVRDAKES